MGEVQYTYSIQVNDGDGFLIFGFEPSEAPQYSTVRNGTAKHSPSLAFHHLNPSLSFGHLELGRCSLSGAAATR